MGLFKSWFIDFDHVDSSDLIDSPIGKIPRNWKLYNLSDFLPVITGKKNANIASSYGKYPFFSCSQNIAWTNEYSFDAHAILVAGNGDFNVKRYSGKFEAYQRTYVLIPNEKSYTSWLYYLIKYYLDKITVTARGSVIKFITKGSLANLTFAAPCDLQNMKSKQVFSSINQFIDENTRENHHLQLIRNNLMTNFLNGKIDVSNIKF